MMNKAADEAVKKHGARITVAITGYLIITFLSIALLFICAGSTEWVWGWAVSAVMLTGGITGIIVTGPELIAERANISGSNKNWDFWLAPLMGRLGPMIILAVAGLDYRYGWSGSVPVAFGFTGIALFIIAYVVITWAMVENKFFSYVVRIQKDRGQYVVDTGPYSIVRHPGYAGNIIYVLSLPLALMAWWAFVPAAAVIIISVIRTTLEDATLIRELEGYIKYSEKVRYRLLPGVW